MAQKWGFDRGYAVLGKKYDASPSTIRDIVQYKTRKNII